MSTTTDQGKPPGKSAPRSKKGGERTKKTKTKASPAPVELKGPDQAPALQAEPEHVESPKLDPQPAVIEPIDAVVASPEPETIAAPSPAEPVPAEAAPAEHTPAVVAETVVAETVAAEIVAAETAQAKTAAAAPGQSTRHVELLRGWSRPRRRRTPLSPFLPWHTSQRCAKITAPSFEVPRPTGSSFPSGPIMWSKPWISAWLRGVPTLG